MNKKKNINLKSTNNESKIAYNFDLYEDDVPLYQEEFIRFLENKPELEDAQMIRILSHDEIFISENTQDCIKQIPMKTEKIDYDKIELDKMQQNQPFISSSMYTVVAPRHLRSLAEICKTYGKGRESVKKWFEEGAPIAFDGFSYFSEYHTLQNWLVERGRRLKVNKVS